MNIPDDIRKIINILYDAGFEAFIVGGCVRDSLMGKDPEDWDLATNAQPAEIQSIFMENNFKCFYENDFGTVGVVFPPDPQRKFSSVVEITTYRTESIYSDKRHPDKIGWAKTIEEDLGRRDFTVNAIALAMGEKSEIRNPKSETPVVETSFTTGQAPVVETSFTTGQANSKFQIPNSKLILIDPYGGKEDVKKKIIRAVRNPEERFNEDALRMFRAVRFAATLDFVIETKTLEAIKKNILWLEKISKERIRDELIKMIMSPRAAKGIDLLREVGMLEYVIPELVAGYGVEQNKHHIYDCYRHNLLTLDYAAQKGFGFHVRMAALLHDIAKPAMKSGEGLGATFYNHEVVGAKMVREILQRLKFSKNDSVKIVKLVRYHLFYYNVGEVSESSIRRLIRQVGKENMEDLLKLRMCDRIGSGVPKAEPYKLRHLKYLIEKISRDPISVKMLVVGGDNIMKLLDIGPGPKIGWILDILLSQVLFDPKKNTKEYLEKEIEKLRALADKDLSIMGKKAKNEIDEIDIKKDTMTKEKYWVT